MAAGNHELLREESLRRIEQLLAKAAAEGAQLGLSRDELHDMLDVMAEEATAEGAGNE